MTDKQRLQYILDNTDSVSLESIFMQYFTEFSSDTPVATMMELLSQITNVLEVKVQVLNRATCIADERARWVKDYLEGRMWPDEETAKKNVQPQINNCQAIIDACNYRGDFY